MILEYLWLISFFLHVIPLGVYILYLYYVVKKKSWDVHFDKTYEPNVTLIVPTYNESSVITNKLENLKKIQYPSEKIEFIIIDSASSDGTYEKIFSWIKKNDEQFLLLREEERKGKSHALNVALKKANGEIVGISDAEATWAPGSLCAAIKYLADANIGAVTGTHRIYSLNESQAVEVEKTYRSIYQIVNVGESKLHSTPIFEGELALYRKALLERFPEDIGADDVGAALGIIQKGYRSIAVPEAIFFEPTPFSWRERFKQKIRRAQHVMQAFYKYRHLLFSNNTVFHNLIFPMNMYIYLLNPIFGLFFIIMSLFLALKYIYLFGLIVFLIIPQIRTLVLTHLSNIFIILFAYFNELRGNQQLVWVKIDETRLDAK